MSISAAELASIQTEAAKWVCDKSCSIYRDATQTTPDGYGGETTGPSDTGAYTLIATTVCGIGEPTGTHLQNYDYLIASEESLLVHLPIGTDVVERDHIVVESQVLEVHVILTPRSYPALLDVICAEIK